MSQVKYILTLEEDMPDSGGSGLKVSDICHK